MHIKSVTITIAYGNDAMQNERNLVGALRETADRIELHGLESVTKVLDYNGNSVGTVDIMKGK